MKKISSLAILAVFLLLAIAACHRKPIIPSEKFIPYISAYTGGIISSDRSIRIELANPVDMVEISAEVEQDLFSFNPSIKGKAYWVDNSTIEFVPDPGQLKQGTLYNGEFKLGKVTKTEKELEEFPFSFQVIQQNFTLENETYWAMNSQSTDLGLVTGTIRFSDKIEKAQVEKMLSAELGEQVLPVKIETTGESKVFKYTVENIKRPKTDKILTIKAAGKVIDVKKNETDTTLIPATGSFRLLTVRSIQLPENGLEVVFSDPIRESQNIRDFFSIDGYPDIVSEVDKNKIRLYFEKKNSSDENEMKINIYKQLKNISGTELGKSSTISFKFKSMNPQVKIPYSGTILPDSKNLVLPFQTINLWAVDLQIIQIYENNVLRFMQNNTLEGNSSSEIKRSGRLVYKKTLRLDVDESKRLDRLSNFSIDLAKIMKQQPGAIYRIILSFKKEYSLYPCNGAVPAKLSQEALAALSPDQISEEEMKKWDSSRDYYYYDYDDYYYYDDDEESGGYRWEDRNNPCKPTFYMENDNTTDVCNVFGSNLGLIAKSNTNNKIWLAVNNILTAKPVENATVKILNYQLQTIGNGKTDKDGFATIETKGGKPFIAYAEQGVEKAYLRLANGEDKSLSRFDIGGKTITKGLKGYTYGERSIWRPGDTIFLTFVLEDKEKQIPDNHPVSIEVFNPRGQFSQKQISTSGINGFYTFKIITQPDDPTGLWNAYIKVGGSSFYKGLRVETIKPNRLKINLSIPDDIINAWEKDLKLKLNASWLTGAKASNLAADIEMSLIQTYNPFKGYEKYVFRSPVEKFYSSQTKIFEGKLDENGNADISINMLEAENAPGMLRANLVTKVYENGGNASINAQSVLFSPFKNYVGIDFGQQGYYESFETDKNHIFNIVTLNPHGKPVNLKNVEYKIYKLKWSWWWESNYETFDSYVNGTSAKPVSSGKMDIINGKGQINFRINYPEWGRYLVYVKDLDGGHATGGIIYVDWPSWRGRSMKDDPSGLTMLTFSTDKTSYEVGEEVTVMIPGGVGGRALMSLENGTSVIKREWLTVADSGYTKRKFKVTEEMAPNFYIHVSLLQPHAQTINNLPIRLYGVVPVSVNNKNSILYPQITVPDVLRPEKEFSVQVKEKTGRPMTYTLAIVDEGLLDITNFKTPNPWDEFYAREALGIKTWDMYDYVIGAFGGKFAPLLSIGGGEDLNPNKEKANRFKPVVKFLGPFTLAKGQTASHKVTLPPYIGSVRVMVVAGGEGAYGKTEKAVPVRSPLMVLPTLPRVVSVGEQIQLPVTVFAMEEGVKDVTIKAESSGKLKILESSCNVTFSEKGDKMVYFNLQVGTKIGIEKVKVTANGNGFTASEEIEIEVRNPNPPIISSINKLLGGQKTEELGYHLLSKSDENWVKLEISRIPSVDLTRRIDFLKNYTHNCSEQIISKAFPLLYVDKLKTLTKDESDDTKSSVQRAIQHLYSRQLSNGGIVYWPGNHAANDWVTTYAGHFMYEAQQKGYNVNPDFFKKWKKYQKNLAKDWTYGKNTQSTRYSYNQSDLDAAYRLYTLALSGSPEQSLMNKLKETPNLARQAKWRLAAAYALIGNKKVANDLIFNVSSIIENYSSNNNTYGSSLRDNAMILETLLLLDNTEKAFVQAQTVSKQLNEEYYFSTQSSAFGLLAMGKLAERMSNGMIDLDWEIDGTPQTPIKTAATVFQMTIPVKVLTGTVKLKNKSTGELFVTLVSKTKPLVDTLPLVQKNIKMTITYLDLEGKTIEIQKLPQGKEFTAKIDIQNISPTGANFLDLALTHIIPAGWEIYNDRALSDVLGTSSHNGNFTYQDIRDDRVLTYFDLYYRRNVSIKIRLQAAYVGRFILPAILCEGMYDTQIQARSTAGWVEVVK